MNRILLKIKLRGFNLKNFFRTVAIVTLFSICEKFLGFIYRIFLSRSIGSEGIGIYQVALSVFALLLTICSSGTPITVSRLMTKYKAENRIDKVRSVISAGISFTLMLSVPLCVLFFAFHEYLGGLFADPRCLKVFLVILPALIINSLYAVFRGVFWGEKDFLSYSVLELLEETCMIIVGIFLITRAKDIYQGAYYAGVAVAISYVFSFSLAIFVFFFRRNRLVNPKPELKPLIYSAVPVTAMRTASSLATSLVSILLPLRLVSAGYTNAQALSLFGSASGQAMPILFIPTTLIGSFTLVLIPEISENFYLHRHNSLKTDVEKAVKFTVFLSCLFVPVFTVCGEEIGILIFDSYECGKFLSASAFLMVFMGLSSVTTSILNSLGLEKQTLLFFIIGAFLMLFSVFFLPKLLGIYSLLVGYAFVYVLTTVLNLVLIQKHCQSKPQYKTFLVKAIGFLLPTVLMGFMLEKMLLPVVGSVASLFIICICLCVFISALFLGFGLIDVKFLGVKFSARKRKNGVTRNAVGTNR